MHLQLLVFLPLPQNAKTVDLVQCLEDWLKYLLSGYTALEVGLDLSKNK